MNLEKLFTSSTLGFGVETATPIQRAVCRVIAGDPLEELAEDPEVIEAFGGKVYEGETPKEVLLLASTRSGKSVIAAATAIRVARTVDLSGLVEGEIPRVAIVSASKDNAKVIFHLISGTLQARANLREWLVDEPTRDTVLIRHPSGRTVEIVVSAGSRAGASLVSRWMAAVIFDEAARMVGKEDGVINLEDGRDAVLSRIRPGGLILYITSPWQPYGPVYEWFTELWGHPTADFVVVRGRGAQMNPGYWTAERIADLKKRRPVVYRTDAMAEFADPETNPFTEEMLMACTMRGVRKVPYVEGQYYTAWMDPATRANAWTLVIVTCPGLGGPAGLTKRYQVSFATQWVAEPGTPLRPGQVLDEVRDILEEYHLDSVGSDQYAADFMVDMCEERGFQLVSKALAPKNKWEMIASFHGLVKDELIELVDDPTLRRDFQITKKRVTNDGIKWVFPKSNAGRHCDYVPAVAGALAEAPDLPIEDDTTKLDDGEEWLEEMNRRESMPLDEQVAERWF